MNVLSFLTPKAMVAYLDTEDTLRQAIEKMEFHRFSVIPCIDADGKYRCTYSEGDLLFHLKNHRLDFDDLEQVPLKDVTPRRSYVALPVSVELEELLPILLTQNFVPLVDDQGVFIGIITRKAVMSKVSKEMFLQDNR